MPVGRQIVEVERAPHQQRVLDRRLEMAVRALDCAVLVGNARIVAGRPHAVMAAQLLVAAREVFLGVALEVAEGGRQTVGTMALRNPAERPQRILQTLRERHEAFATEHHVGMLEAGERQAKMIEPMIETIPRNRHPEFTHVGEVRQAEPAGLVLLAEDHIQIGAMERPPGPHPPFQRPAHAGADLRVPATDLVEHRDRTQPRCGLQHRDDLAVPDAGKRIGPTPAPGRLLPRWQSSVVLDPIGGGSAEPGFRRGQHWAVGLTELHVHPHLAVGDVLTGQR